MRTVPLLLESTSNRPRRFSKRDIFLDDLRKYIIDNVDTNSWKDNGGEVGDISTNKSKTLLLITQTPENQRKIVAALKEIRDVPDRVISDAPTTMPK